jgi:hypothetical protein
VRPAIFCVLVLVAACGKSAEQCRTEARELGALFAGIDTEPGPIWSTEAKLVARAELPKLGAYGPMVTLFAGRIELEGRPGSQTREMLAESLTATHRELVEAAERGRSHRGDPRRIYVLIDEATPWREVVAAVETASAAGFTAPSFVFRHPVTLTPPPRAAVDDELDRILGLDPSERATAFARLLEAQVADCAAVQNIFADIGSSEAESKSQTLLRRLPDALIDCKCDVPMADFRSTLWRLLVIPQPMRGFEVALVATGTRIALPAATPWSTASQRFDPSTKTVQLVVE